MKQEIREEGQSFSARYGICIGLLGGVDVDLLCQNKPKMVFEIVLERGWKYRAKANGYALGSGDSIPDYVPIDNYLAMREATKKIREFESSNT